MAAQRCRPAGQTKRGAGLVSARRYSTSSPASVSLIIGSLSSSTSSGRMDQFFQPVLQREKFRRENCAVVRGRGTGFSIISMTPPGIRRP